MGFLQNFFGPRPDDPTGGQLSNELLLQIGSSIMQGANPQYPGGVNLAPSFAGIAQAVSNYGDSIAQYEQQELQKRLAESRVAYNDYRLGQAKKEDKEKETKRILEFDSKKNLAQQAVDLELLPDLPSAMAYERDDLEIMLRSRIDELDNWTISGRYRINTQGESEEVVPRDPSYRHIGGGTFVDPVTDDTKQFTVPDRDSSEETEERGPISPSEFRTIRNEVAREIIAYHVQNSGVEVEDIGELKTELYNNPTFLDAVRQATIQELLSHGYTIDDIPPAYKEYNPEATSETEELSVEEQLDRYIRE